MRFTIRTSFINFKTNEADKMCGDELTFGCFETAAWPFQQRIKRKLSEALVVNTSQRVEINTEEVKQS